jgi:hypothetical protein
MNERIKQLALQAGNYVNEVYTGPVRSKTPGKIWEDGHVGWHTQFNEKFAELIVGECVGIVDKIGPPGYADYPDYRDQIEQAFRRECATEIKKHFGVGE